MVARKTTAKADTKPARRTRKAPEPEVEEEPDLLGGLDEPEAAAEEEDDDLDLLDGITEDNGTAWMPWDDEDQPVGIQGKVTYIGEVDSDYSDDMVPLIELEAKDGTLWSIRGYAQVLANQIKKNQPEVGDFFAVKYLGEKPGKRVDKKTKEPVNYKNFKAAVKHA
jgi:hypothetical protein